MDTKSTSKKIDAPEQIRMARNHSLDKDMVISIFWTETLTISIVLNISRKNTICGIESWYTLA